MTVSKFLDNFEEYFCVWTMAIMTVIVFIQIVMRYVFSNSALVERGIGPFHFPLALLDIRPAMPLKKEATSGSKCSPI